MTDNRRNMKELTDIYLNDDAAVNEFDSIMSGFRRRQFVRRTAAVAATILILVCAGLGFKSFSTSDSYADITTVEMIETIGVLADSDVDDINCVTAKPGRNGILVIAEFKTGMKRTYLMKRGADGSSIEMTAQNL